MNEAETRAEHIDPALKAVDWGVIEGSVFCPNIPSRRVVSKVLDGAASP